MERLQGRVRGYAWGGPATIPELFGYPPANGPVAEVWLGAHPEDSARVGAGASAPLFDPEQLYGDDARSRENGSETAHSASDRLRGLSARFGESAGGEAPGQESAGEESAVSGALS
ncbi:MAG: type I phosphomannose isomerase catalytic subunit, partial [Ancrocorticia sp.]|uniref:type I phosphomannose isomerase catalytic subunit n=1 Tax=Ancrocorticia sp. TaxID=2593684 RepID=UPI003F8FD4FA